MKVLFVYAGIWTFLHKEHIKIINTLSQVGPVEIITNGDTERKRLTEIYNPKASRLLISLYDGEEQLKN